MVIDHCRISTAILLGTIRGLREITYLEAPGPAVGGLKR